MENKITGKRLAHFLSYDWFALVALVAAAIFVLNLIYSFSAVKLTTGQIFTFYYDQNIDSHNVKSVWSLIHSEKNGTSIFSYDVKEIQVVPIYSSNNTLSSFLQNKEGDMIVTDIAYHSDTKDRRMCSIVDGGYMYNYEGLLKDAKTYLLQFVSDDTKNTLIPEGTVADYDTIYALDIYDFDNQYDEEKIKAVFLERMKGDNRFRTDEQKQEGFSLEVNRIKNLVRDTAVLDKILKLDDSLPEEESFFFDYTRHAQQLETATSDREKQDYQEWYDSQIEYNKGLYGGRYLMRYGFKLEKLSGEGKESVGEFFKKSSLKADESGAKDVVIMPISFKNEQPHLQYETITLFAKIVRTFSNLAD